MEKFLTTHRAEIITRARAKIAQRVAPRPTPEEMSTGIPIFLDQLIATFRHASDDPNIGPLAAAHGGDLLKRGFTVGQVVHDYGSLCQAITELAVELDAKLSAEDYQTLNRCLDDATAEAVTEYSRSREQAASDAALEKLAFLAHELRNALNTATLAFAALRGGGVGIAGSTSAIVERSFRRLRDLIDGSLSEVRLDAGLMHRAPVVVAALIEEVSIGAALEAADYGVHLTVSSVEYGAEIEVDAQMVSAALLNLLQNAFKFTRPNGHVLLETQVSSDHVAIAVADECGGLPTAKLDDLFRVFDPQGTNRTGLGLGLAISRRSIEENGGELRVRNVPGTGCVLTAAFPRHYAPV